MTLQPVVSPEQWQAARDRLLVKEKAATRAGDALAAERRRLPWVQFRNDYRFDSLGGELSILDLFEGRRQLIVYHFMLDQGADPCVGCSMFVDNLGDLSHLHRRDTSFTLCSRAPIAESDAYRERMGWDVPWVQTVDERFYADCGVTTSFGLSVFIRDDHDVYRSYFTTSRAVEAIGSVWSLLDLTPLGRQEVWEDSPQGTPQTDPYQWWRRHDEYEQT